MGAASGAFSPKTRVFSGHRSGKLEVQESPFAHVGMEVPEVNDFRVEPTQEKFARNLKPPLTCTELRAARQHPSSQEDTKFRRRK